MAKIIIDSNGVVLDLVADGIDGIEISAADHALIANSKYGHTQFKYLNGVLSENADKVAELDLDFAKQAKISQIINQEIIKLATQQAAVLVTEVRSKTTITEVEKL